MILPCRLSHRSVLDERLDLIFHAGIGEGDAFFTVTIWETRDAYDAFVPVFARVMNEQGFQFGQPEILPVHQVLPRPADS